MQWYKKIGLAIFASVIMIFSGGLSHYAHFCKSELVAARFVIPVDPCNAGGDKPASAKTCQLGEEPEGDGNFATQSNCCDDINTHLSLDNYAKDEVVSADQTDNFTGVLPFLAQVPFSYHTNRTLKVRPPPLPLKLTGKLLRIRYQSFLC